MKKNLTLLILGALFSLFLIEFDLRNGFEFLNIKLKFSLFDYAGKSSNENFLTTQFIGYIFFLIYIFSIKKHLKNINLTFFWIFLVALLIGLSYETIAIIENLRNDFNGIHLRIGNSLTILGIYLFSLIRKTGNEKD